MELRQRVKGGERCAIWPIVAVRRKVFCKVLVMDIKLVTVRHCDGSTECIGLWRICSAESFRSVYVGPLEQYSCYRVSVRLVLLLTIAYNAH